MNNYHTHTYRCGHAVGNERDMVEAALKIDCKVLGFSEHVPLPRLRYLLLQSFPHSFHSIRSVLSCIKNIIKNGPSMRMTYKNKFEHEKCVKQLKEEYKNQIDILQGYECEYFKNYLPYYKSMLDNNEVDYLILGNHFNKYPIHNYYYGKNKISDEMLVQYRQDIIEAIHTGLFSYIAHPDLFMMGRDEFDELAYSVSLDICKEAKLYNIPLEINAGGIRKGYKQFKDGACYPYCNQHFFEIASQIGNDIILGIDAHDPKDFNQQMVDELYAFAKKNNLHIVESIQLKKKI